MLAPSRLRSDVDGLTPRPPAPSVTLEPVQRHDLTLLAVLRGVSLLGDFAALTALYLRLAPAHHAWAIAALSIAASLPLVALAPLAGSVVDRSPAKRLLVYLGLGQAAICVALGHWHGLDATILLMAALSCLVAFSMPGYTALVPVVAGEENVARAQGVLQSAQALASVAGPVVGGLLVGATGQSWPLYLDAISFAVAAVVTTLLHRDRRPSPATVVAEVNAQKEGMLAGIQLIFGDGLLRVILVTVGVFMLSLGMVNIAEVFFVTQTLHGSATEYGLVGASFGVGAVVGSLLAQRLAQEHRRLARTVLIAIVVIGAALVVEGLVTRVGLVYPPMAAAGVAAGFANVAAMTLFTVRTPERLRGRMFAAFGGVFTSCELAATALGGVVLTVIAPRTVFQIGGIAATVTALVLGPLGLRWDAARSSRAVGEVDS
ncbi:MAG TPA: MFS transporter [Acidimicrobiales bacterium]|nr:MFS transporter [Acidimicrobiales bacterium]